MTYNLLFVTAAEASAARTQLTGDGFNAEYAPILNEELTARDPTLPVAIGGGSEAQTSESPSTSDSGDASQDASVSI